MQEVWSLLIFILVGIALAGLAALLIRYSRDMRAARKRVESLGSQVIETPSGPIEYVLAGEGYPMLVIHGAIGGFDQGLFVAKSIRCPQCQIISVSRIGHLRSPVPKNADLNTQADAFAGLLDALGKEKVIVFAISSGSTAAIRFVARHPQRVSALILFGPDPGGENQIALPPRFVFDVLFRSNFLYWVLITYFRKSLQKTMGLVPKGYIPTPGDAARIEHILMGDLPIDQRIDGLIFETYTIEAEYNIQTTDSSPYPIKNIAAPVFIINAQDDPLAKAEYVQALADKFPNKRHYVIPDGGHLFFNHDQEVRSEILHFLADKIPELNMENFG